MTDTLWDKPPALTIISQLPTPAGKCVKYPGESDPCRICTEGLRDELTIDPVAVYRWWNVYDNCLRERLHAPTSWLIVAPFLREHGYQLKTRSGTIGPKIDEPSSLLYDITDACELPTDFSLHTYPAFDKNGTTVYIKTVPLDSPEFEVWRALSTQPLRSHAKNHAIPVIDVLKFYPDFSSFGHEIKSTDARAFVIMPAMQELRPLKLSGVRVRNDYPALVTALDVSYMAYQLAQGLAFMHRHGMAHLDVAVHNVLWDGNELARRFYFIDYQYSRRYPLPRTTAPPIHPLWRYGIDGEGSMNPFEVDVFRLGDLLEGICRMLPVRRGSELSSQLEPLRVIAASTKQELNRPNMDKVEHDLAAWLRTFGVDVPEHLHHLEENVPTFATRWSRWFSSAVFGLEAPSIAAKHFAGPVLAGCAAMFAIYHYKLVSP